MKKPVTKSFTLDLKQNFMGGCYADMSEVVWPRPMLCIEAVQERLKATPEQVVVTISSTRFSQCRVLRIVRVLTPSGLVRWRYVEPRRKNKRPFYMWACDELDLLFGPARKRATVYYTIKAL